MKKPLIVLTGPTAAGKTELSIALAKKLNGAIISADSMQVYKYMNIGSAKIRPEEMQGVRHYLVDVLDPREEFHVARFQQMAKEAMDEIYRNGQLPIVVGGTGFYIQALLKDIDFDESSGELPCRKELEETARREGGAVLYERLKQVDPESAEAIHPNNVKRVIRALEFYQETGQPISLHNKEQKEKQPPYTYAYFVLNDDRARLYERIDRRVDRMVEQGLVEEVRCLKEHGYDRSLVSMQGLGYKELFPYLDGTCSLEEAVEIIKRDTRHFAKRQITWFKREPDVIWLNQQEFGYDKEKILKRMLELWEERKKS
ncbi:MAG: tRNA (adenosine(37)-N6)-dimethylallyltransferase MiaA [Lachnospiraceae bacterium]|nr:tRNA (adenosine(37)-N6)-dimethylallyltransferase MiaA [Lachnospiraceae bacterium]